MTGPDWTRLPCGCRFATIGPSVTYEPCTPTCRHYLEAQAEADRRQLPTAHVELRPDDVRERFGWSTSPHYAGAHLFDQLNRTPGTALCGRSIYHPPLPPTHEVDRQLCARCRNAAASILATLRADLDR